MKKTPRMTGRPKRARPHRVSVRRNINSPLDEYDPISCMMRFFGAMLFGLFLDIVILCCCGIVLLMGYKPGFGWLSYTLIAVPLIWGLGGIFFFSEMLDLADEIIERFFLFWR